MTSTDPRTEGSVVGELTDGVATVCFSHQKSNSLPGALLRRIAEEIATFAAEPRTRVIVLRSEGTGVFCAGASFDEMRAVHDTESGQEFFSGFAQVILAMIRAPQFVLARVQGKVAGGGVGMIAAADYSFAVRGASLKLSELVVGLGPFVIGPVVQRKVGFGPFAALSVDADWRDAEWGERHGLYSRLFEDAEAMDAELEKLTRFLVAANPEAMRELKRVFWADTEGWEALLHQRALTSGRLALSEYTRAAIAKLDRSS